MTYMLVELDPSTLTRFVHFARACGVDVLMSFGQGALLVETDPSGAGPLMGVLLLQAECNGNHPPVRVTLGALEKIHDHSREMATQRSNFALRRFKAETGAYEAVMPGDRTAIQLLFEDGELTCGTVSVPTRPTNGHVSSWRPPSEPPAGITLDGTWIDAVMPVDDEDVWDTQLILNSRTLAARSADSHRELDVTLPGVRQLAIEARAVRAVFGSVRYYEPLTLTAEGQLFTAGCLVQASTLIDHVIPAWTASGQTGRWDGHIDGVRLLSEFSGCDRVPINTADATLFAPGGEGSVLRGSMIGIRNSTRGKPVSVTADRRAARFEWGHDDGSRYAVVLPVDAAMRLDYASLSNTSAERPALRIVGPPAMPTN